MNDLCSFGDEQLLVNFLTDPVHVFTVENTNLGIGIPAAMLDPSAAIVHASVHGEDLVLNVLAF